MGEITHFPQMHNDPILFLNDLAQRGLEPKGIIVLMKMPDGTWQTGWSGCDVATHAEAIAHAQIDLMDRFIRNNINRYIKYQYFFIEIK